MGDGWQLIQDIGDSGREPPRVIHTTQQSRHNGLLMHTAGLSRLPNSSKDPAGTKVPLTQNKAPC